MSEYNNTTNKKFHISDQSVQKKFVQPVKIMDLPLIKQPLKPIVMNNVTNVNSVLEMLLKLYQNAKNFA